MLYYNVVEIKEAPKIIKTGRGGSSPYLMFLQSLFEILGLHRTDDKLQEFSCKIAKERIAYISTDKDLLDNFNVKRNIIKIVLLLNDENVDIDLIDSILTFDKEYHDIDLGRNICVIYLIE